MVGFRVSHRTIPYETKLHQVHCYYYYRKELANYWMLTWFPDFSQQIPPDSTNIIDPRSATAKKPQSQIDRWSYGIWLVHHGAPHSIVGSSPMIHTTLQLATWLWTIKTNHAPPFKLCVTTWNNFVSTCTRYVNALVDNISH